MSNEPQSNVHIIVVPCDAALEQTPTAKEVCLLACPDGVNLQLELLSVSFRTNTLPVDGSNVATIDLEFIDDSDSDSVTNLKAAFDLLSGITVLINNEVWRGSQVLDPGDVINVEFTTTTPDTASEGAAFIVEYKVLRRS